MMNIYKIVYFIILLIFFSGCKKDDEPETLTVSKSKIEISGDGGQDSFEITTNAASWIIRKKADWLTLSENYGTESKATISVSVATKALTDRTDTLSINAGNANPVKVIVTQTKSQSLAFKIDKTSIDFKCTEETVSITVTSDYPEWSLTSDKDWITINPISGGIGETIVSVKAKDNTEAVERSASIQLTANNAPNVSVTVTQKAGGVPSYNTNPITPDATGMSSNASELAGKIKLGWNIGNTLEAIGGETAWGNPKITEAYIKKVKQLGFNAIRLPCSWDQNANKITDEISQTWLNRVKEVVGYCVNNDMYVLLNIHYDGGWLEKHCTVKDKNAVNVKQKAYWEQIATTLRDFDEHLIFAGANEPDVETAEQMNVLMSYHQTFIDAVRSTGGKNSYRVLVVQGPATDIEKTNNLMNTMPKDEISGRLMVEIHYYTPYQFTLLDKDESWGKMFYYWGEGHHSTVEPDRNADWGEESDLNKYFGLIKSKFVDKNIPVILGEYGAYRRTTPADMETHNNAVDYWNTCVTKKAIESGMLPFYWDTGGAINRNSNTVTDQRTIDAILKGTE